jgi:hypothetical protein
MGFVLEHLFGTFHILSTPLILHTYVYAYRFGSKWGCHAPICGMKPIILFIDLLKDLSETG